MNWREVKLAEVCGFKTGKLNSNAAVPNGIYPFFTCAQETYYINEAAFDTEAVLLGGNNANGVYPLKYYKGKFNAYQRTYVIEALDKDILNIKFVYYTLSLALGIFQQESIGSITRYLTKPILDNFPVKIPSLIEQNLIVGILSNYDDLIQTNQQRIMLLEEAAQRLYDEWFVKLRFPNYEQVPVADGVPEGWEKLAIDNIFTLQRGFDLPNNQRKEGSTPVYASTGLNGFHDQAMVDYPTVITGRSGSLGQVLYSRTPCWPLNTTLWVKDFKRTTPIHAFFLLKGLGLEGLNGGSAVPTLNRNDVHRIQIVAPNLPLILVFDQKVKPIFDQVDILSQQNQKLMQARDDLLPRLMSGRLDVSTLSAVGEE